MAFLRFLEGGPDVREPLLDVSARRAFAVHELLELRLTLGGRRSFDRPERFTLLK